jgi:hypothetical protein
MSPEAYLRLSIQHKAYLRKNWIFGIFAFTQDSDVTKTQIYTGKLVREPYGVFTYNDALERIQLDVDPTSREPLFRPSDRIEITQELVPSLRLPSIQTSVGTLLVNLVCLLEAFGSKFPYVDGKITPRMLEDLIAAKLKDTPKREEDRRDDYYYVDEYLRFCKGVSFLEPLCEVIAHSITRQGLMPAPGRQAFKEKLLKEKYEGKLTDPVMMSQFEKELEAFDSAYLASDPAKGKFMSGKVSKSRMKLFMTQGGEEDGFTGRQGVTPVIPSLEEGVPLKPEAFASLVNASRYGSFSRGAETVNGGVVAKGVGRAADAWRIVKGDCGTSFGIHRFYTTNDTDKLIGRYVIEGKSVVLIENSEQAKKYSARSVLVRSPQYCRSEGTTTCEICAGLALSKYPEGLSIPLMAVSGGILNDSLKKMHNNAVVTATMLLSETIS